MNLSGRTAIYSRLVAPVVAVAVVAGAIGVVLWTNGAAAQASDSYQRHRQALGARLAAAQQQGDTSQDLQPITAQVDALDRSPVPWGIPGRAGYFDQLTARADDVGRQLDALQRRLLAQAQGDAARQVAGARAQIA